MHAADKKQLNISVSGHVDSIESAYKLVRQKRPSVSPESKLHLYCKTFVSRSNRESTPRITEKGTPGLYLGALGGLDLFSHSPSRWS